jgi:hypothetical protein
MNQHDSPSRMDLACSAKTATRGSNGRRGWKLIRTDRCFFSCLFVSLLVLMTVAVFPVISDWMEDWTGYEYASVLGMAKRKPIYRLTVFRLASAWMIVGIAYYGLCFRKRRLRTLRTLALIGAGVYHAGLIVANERLIHEKILLRERETNEVFEQQWPHFQRLKMIDCENARVNAFQARDEMRVKGITRFADFHQCVMEQYHRAEPRLKKCWSPVADDDVGKMKTLFIMNFVSGLWSFGNREAQTKQGCVFCNEQNQWKAPAESLATYLEAQIGCCTDFAYLTKSLLDHEKIENRLTEIPGHIFNEVKLGNRWRIVDATANLFVGCSWEELYEQDRQNDSVVVLLFPHSNLADARSIQYRSVAGQFRAMTLARIANPPFRLRPSMHPELPRFFAQTASR